MAVNQAAPLKVATEVANPLETNITEIAGVTVPGVAGKMPIEGGNATAVNVSLGAVGTPAGETAEGAISDGATQAGTPEYVPLTTTFPLATTATLKSFTIGFGRGAQVKLVANDGLGARTTLWIGDISQAGGTVGLQTISTEIQIIGSANSPFFEACFLNRDKNDADQGSIYASWET